MRVSEPKPGMRKAECSMWRHMVGGDTYIDTNLPGKSVVNVSADYLSKVRGAFSSQLQTSLGEVFTRDERYRLLVHDTQDLG